jgi:methylmalonyl-CoA mutase N-terminal domain/subunit
MGGMIAAIEQGFPQREIADASYAYQRAVETGEKIVVGVNAFQSPEEPIELLQIDRTAADRQRDKLALLKARRDNKQVCTALDDLRRAAGDGRNMMPSILDAVRAYATVGEMSNALRDIFGSYRESSQI